MNNIIFMKYGSHALENVDSIILRKQKEIENVGFCFWGYGGTLLHPLKQVLPFANDKYVYIFFMKTESEFLGEGTVYKYYSIDNIKYEKVPMGIKVTGSKKALVFNNLRKVDIRVNLCDYEIAIGPSKGKNLSDYMKGRVDKACAVLTEKSKGEKIVHIDYIAELVEPYAVFLKEEI